MSYNIWSGGEYLQNKTGFINSVDVTCSYSIDTGIPSLLTTVTGTGNSKWVRCAYEDDLSNYSSAKFKVDVYSPNSECSVRLIQVVDGTQTILNTTNVSPNEDFTTIEASGNISPEASLIYCMVVYTGGINTKFYTRNWELIVS